MTVMMGGGGGVGRKTEKRNFSFEQQQAGNVESVSDGVMHVAACLQFEPDGDGRRDELVRGLGR
jgi:hypothetical protein